MTNRRKFMAILGGGVLLAAAGGSLWASTRDPARARMPWEAAGAETDPRRKALSYAILAPNPHNRQPWVADLSIDDEITLICDLERRLPHTDPFDRQITLGLGCFLELLVQAAAQDGYLAQVALFPEGEPQPRLDNRRIARVRFEKRATPRDPLFAQVLKRRSNRGDYDLGREVDGGALRRVSAAALASRVDHTAEPRRVAMLRALGWEAMRTEASTYTTMKESVDLIRIGRAEIEANPDGISLAGPFFEALSAAGLLAREEMLDTSSTTFRQQMEALKAPFDTAMGFLWLTTPGNSRADQIRAGRDYVRVNLAATSEKLSMQPFSQALQEFPEMRPHFVATREALRIAPEETLQMFVRLGYGPEPKPSPRWPHPSRIRSA